MTPRTVSLGVLIGLAALVPGGLGTAVLLLVLSLALADLSAERGIERHARAALDQLKAQPASELLPVDRTRDRPLVSWSTAELCQAWRVTYVQLHQHPGAVATERLADQRRGQLDELQRRDPAGFANWFASGARAAGDPTRYLSPAPRSR